MAATLGTERYESQGGVQANKDGFTDQQIFEVLGETSPDAAALALSVLVGGFHSTLPFTVVKSVTIDIEESGENGTQLLAILDFGPLDPGDNNFDENGERWDWDIVAQTSHINSVNEVGDQLTWDDATVDPGGTSVGQNKFTMIGVDGSTTHGTDVFRPRGSVRVTKWFDLATVDKAFRQDLYGRQNTVNVDQWFDWEIREALFLGARFQNNYTTERTRVEYNFLFGIQQQNLQFDVFGPASVLSAPFQTVTVGEVVGPTHIVYPFQFLWFEFEVKTVQDSIGFPTKYENINGMKSVNLANVYDRTIFADFGFVGPGA